MEELKLVKHHLVDIIDPDEDFNVGDFCRLASVSLQEILERGKFPLFVGGTGLYIDSLMKGIAEIPKIDPEVRKNIFLELNKKGLPFLYNELKKVDFEFSKKIHFNDSQRIIRGLEVYRGTGKPLTTFYQNQKGIESEDTVYIGINPLKEELHRRIELRTDLMFEKGFVKEVELLREMGFSANLKSMNSIGYKEINKYLDGKISFEQCIMDIKKETKRYAKRQLTWFRRNKKIEWFPSEKEKDILDFIRNNFKK